MNRKETFWYVLLWASFIAAAVSLMTTGIGLRRYLSFLLAWPLAIAVQAGLFGLAWLIAVGRRRLRPLVVVLYLATMPFSVVFSYVMLQSEFTAEIRPQEAQRELFDDLRQRSAAVAAEIDRSLGETDELELRLASWLAMEQAEGWTTSTCDSSTHCYLSKRLRTGARADRQLGSTVRTSLSAGSRRGTHLRVARDRTGRPQPDRQQTSCGEAALGGH